MENTLEQNTIETDCAAFDRRALVDQLVAAMNANNALWKHSPYRGYEITETRRKYHLLNSILTNGQRSAVFMIDRETLHIRKADGYGKAGRLAGTVQGFIAHYEGINAQMRPQQCMGVVA